MTFRACMYENSYIFAADMNKKGSFWHRVFHLYFDGFRQMTLGRTLWLVIAIKLFVIFFVLKLFFFPDFIGQNAEKGKEADFVATELQQRAP